MWTLLIVALLAPTIKAQTPSPPATTPAPADGNPANAPPGRVHGVLGSPFGHFSPFGAFAPHSPYGSPYNSPFSHLGPPHEAAAHHAHHHAVHADRHLHFIGQFRGSCYGIADGLYYIDEKRFAYCSNNRLTMQDCADGAANPTFAQFEAGLVEGTIDSFCSINLAAIGTGVHHLASTGLAPYGHGLHAGVGHSPYGDFGTSPHGVDSTYDGYGHASAYDGYGSASPYSAYGHASYDGYGHAPVAGSAYGYGSDPYGAVGAYSGSLGVHGGGSVGYVRPAYQAQPVIVRPIVPIGPSKEVTKRKYRKRHRH